MITFLAAAFLLQIPDAGAQLPDASVGFPGTDIQLPDAGIQRPQPATRLQGSLQPDTARIFDSPETESLVVRAIAAMGDIPAELTDYQARVQSTMQITIAADTVGVSDLPATVDEVISDVNWHRRGYLQQDVVGHRMRVLIPLPYTLATIFETPWITPHLYGPRIYSPLGQAPALNPFSAEGPRYYRYQTGDTIRVRTTDQLLTLVPIEVRPRVPIKMSDVPLVVGTFYLDADRAAVARARVGFAGGSGGLPRVMGQIETFLEFENALWDDRFWLPFRQRRDILFESRLLGGGVTARVVNRFDDIRLNTGWEPTGRMTTLTWSDTRDRQAFENWRAPIGDEESELTAQDFADLRIVSTLGGDENADAAARLRLHYDRGNHLFRFNRVEGPYLGVGASLSPVFPRLNRREVYGTAGWAFAENTPRGELVYRQGTTVVALPGAGIDWGLEAALYRRLNDIQPFRPTFMWDWFYTMPAFLWGGDRRDYYDALGAEASLVGRSGRWTGRGGLRFEQQDSVSVNTNWYLLSSKELETRPLAGVDPGKLFALETSAQYSFGPGAFGIGKSFLLRAEAEAGFGDFSYQRVTGLLSTRYSLGPITLATRTDAGYITGDAPAQKLFRFGSIEGLRGYEPNEFGGSAAVLGRARLLLGVPPRRSTPLTRVGLFMIPPLRPNLVLLGETGWTMVSDELAPTLERFGSRTTDGFRSSVGVGVSIFDDALTVERLFPVGKDEGARERKWYVGFTYWY
ncbi:MAG: hypothetical protein LBG44_04435 [Gemmatimonadota bacterium]|jgi:hypothetical protein|nr:hypothetical protein [Gemmatimonadota bacterium]